MIKSSPGEPARPIDVAALALTFEEVAFDVVQGETTEFLSRWYRAKSGLADLTIWWDGERRVVKQQLCVYGQVVEWNPIHGTRTGMVIEHESVGDAHTSGSEVASEIIQFDGKAQKNSVNLAIQLLNAISAVRTEDRELLVFNFRESPRLHKNARERAMKAWAPQGTEILSSTDRGGFWRGLTHWIFGK